MVLTSTAVADLAQWACLVVLGGSLLAAAATDMWRFTIPNRLSAAVALSGIGWVVLDPGTAPIAALSVFAVVLGVGIGLFCLRVAGGGDIKLIAALSLWSGPALILPVLQIIALTGGGIAAALLIARALRPRAATQPAAYPVSARTHVPYAVAIAAGGLWLAWQQASGLGLPPLF